jgi:hypothetical protein
MNGSVPFRRISTADTNAAIISAGPTKLSTLVVGNINASMRYLKLYDKATAPTVGTDAPVFVVPIPGGTSGAGGAISLPNGLQFNKGLAMAITAGIADSDATAIGANEVCVSGAY